VTTVYASIRTYAGNSDLADALAARADEIREVIGGINGFKAYHLVKTGDGTTSISVFDDEAGAEESNRAAAAWLAENLPDLKVASPQVTSGETVVDF
jgi:hypothetical protein